MSLNKRRHAYCTVIKFEIIYREDGSPSEIAAFLLSTAAVLVNVL